MPQSHPQSQSPPSFSHLPPTSGSGEVAPSFPPSIGRYRVLGEIGRGGMGLVVRAFDPGLSRHVAIKLLGRASWEVGGEDLSRFVREARVTAKLRHPNIVAVHEVGTHGAHPFIVMDLVEGETLEDLFRRAPPSPGKLADVAARIADALHHAHENGVLHRDVKPSNILIDAAGQPRLTDFGLARDTGGTMNRLTVTGDVLGTPDYMSPEQAIGGVGKPLGPHTDVWSLGAVLYRGVTGRVPHAGESPLAVLQSVLTQDPIAPRELAPEVHPDLETIVLRCLEKEPARRYRSARELAAELRRFRSGQPVLSRRRGRRERAAAWTRARARPLAAAALALCALATVAAFWLDARGRLAAVDARAAQAAREADEAIERLARERRRAETDPSAREALLAAALDALDAASRAAALDASSAAARRRLFDAAMATGEIAGARGEDAVARAALERAAALGVDASAAEAALARAELEARVAGRPPTGSTAETPTPPPHERVPELLAAAGERAAAGDLPGAIARLDEALGIDPTSVDALVARAEARLLGGDYAAAFADAGAAIGLDPGRALAFSIRAEARTGSGDPGAALDDATRATELDPDLIQGWLALASANALLDRPRPVLAAVEQAVRCDPAQGETYVKAGWAMARLGRTENAIRAYDEALRLGCSSSPAVLAARGNCYAKILELERALRDFDEGLARDPSSETCHALKARTCCELGRYDDAIASARRALELDPRDVNARLSLCRARRNLGRFDEALADVERVLEIDANRDDAHFEVGIILALQDRTAEALRRFERILATDSVGALFFTALGGDAAPLDRPPPPGAGWEASLVAVLRGEIAPRDVLARARDVRPDESRTDREQRAMATGLAGIVAERLGDAETAAACYRVVAQTQVTYIVVWPWSQLRLKQREGRGAGKK